MRKAIKQKHIELVKRSAFPPRPWKNAMERPIRKEKYAFTNGLIGRFYGVRIIEA